MSPTFNKILILCGASLILCLLNIQPGHNWGGDFAMYLSQAKGLLEGNLQELHTINKFSMDQSDLPMGPSLYPMGYPILLVPIYYLFENNFVALKIFNALFFVGSIPLIFNILRSVARNKDLAFYATVLFAINYQLIFMSDSLGSDFPAMFLSFLALHLMLKTRENDSLLNASLLGGTMFFAYITRTAGLVLLPTLMIFYLCHYLKHKQRNTINMILPFAIFIICYLAYGQFFESFDNKYLVLFENVSLQSTGSDVLAYGSFLLEFFVSLKFLPKAFVVFSSFIFFPILAIGIKQLITKCNLFLLCFCAAMLVLHIIYPFTSLRFIIPLIPFVFYAFLNGVNYLSRRFSEQLDVTKWMSVILIVGSILQSLAMIYLQQKNGTNESINPEMQSIYTYINKEISDDEIFVFHKPRVLRLFTDNNAFMLTDFSSDKINLADHLLVPNDGSSYPGFTIQKSWEHYQLYKKE